MDILFGTSWMLALRETAPESTERAPASPAGVSRLLLALAVIAAIVGSLDHAASSGGGSSAIASMAVHDQVGEPR